MKKSKNPLSKVTATICYFMTIRGLSNKKICEKLSMGQTTWINRKHYPEKFTLGELVVIAKILGIDMETLVVGLNNGGIME